MRKKTIALAIIILILLGWLVRNLYFSSVTPEEITSPEPVKVLLPPANEIAKPMQEKPATPDSSIPVSRKGAVGSQPITLDKTEIVDDKPVNLSDYNDSIKKEEKKGFKILPGVTVKSGVAQVQLDQDNSRYIEIERNPANSNSQYQMILRKKF